MTDELLEQWTSGITGVNDVEREGEMNTALRNLRQAIEDDRESDEAFDLASVLEGMIVVILLLVGMGIGMVIKGWLS